MIRVEHEVAALLRVLRRQAEQLAAAIEALEQLAPNEQLELDVDDDQDDTDPPPQPTPIVRHRCEPCKRSFDTPQGLALHRTRVHSAEGEARVQAMRDRAAEAMA